MFSLETTQEKSLLLNAERRGQIVSIGNTRGYNQILQ